MISSRHPFQEFLERDIFPLILKIHFLLKQNVNSCQKTYKNNYFERKLCKMFNKIKSFSNPIQVLMKRHFSDKSAIVSKSDAKNRILSAKNERNLTFECMAKMLGQNKVFLTSAILGEHPFDRQLALDTLKVIGINDGQEVESLLEVMQQMPEIRGDNGRRLLANDPLVYRLNELMAVYGPTLRALIHEMCGDGIMSAVDCGLECDKYQYIDNNSKSERIVIKIDGKFLRYRH